MFKQIISRNLSSLCADVQVELTYQVGKGLACLSNAKCTENLPADVRSAMEKVADLYMDVDFLNEVRATSLNLPFPTSIQNIKNRYVVGMDFGKRLMDILENELGK